VDDLVVRLDTPRGTIHAVDGVSFTLDRGETLGLVGESGCGKSTIARALTRIVAPSSGSIRLHGEELASLPRRALRPHRRVMQMVFQDPAASLDPRWTVGQLLAEPLHVHSVGTRVSRRERVLRLLDQVGLPRDAAERFPHEFSGGQRQRIGLARALALEPEILICDEPVSALDVSVQAQILNLLSDLQKSLGLAILFISHDLSVVEHISDRVAVMYLGRIVEIASRTALFRQPAHPYTRALLDAIPKTTLRPSDAPRQPPLRGDLPSPYARPSGCRFHTRCPIAMDRCKREVPLLEPQDGADHHVACHAMPSGALRRRDCSMEGAPVRAQPA